jgi:hypothetical protein
MPGLACEDGVKWTLTAIRRYRQVCQNYFRVQMSGVSSPLPMELGIACHGRRNFCKWLYGCAPISGRADHFSWIAAEVRLSAERAVRINLSLCQIIWLVWKDSIHSSTACRTGV